VSAINHVVSGLALRCCWLTLLFLSAVVSSAGPFSQLPVDLLRYLGRMLGEPMQRAAMRRTSRFFYAWSRSVFIYVLLFFLVTSIISLFPRQPIASVPPHLFLLFS
jgi:hypothetical protein